MEKMFYAATVQNFTDGDGCTQYTGKLEFLTDEDVASYIFDAIPGTEEWYGDVGRFLVRGKKGKCGWGYFEACAVEIAPVQNGKKVDFNMLSKFAERKRWFAMECIDLDDDDDDDEEVEVEDSNIIAYASEMADEVEVEDDNIIAYASETAKELARKHRKEDIKAKERLRRIYPISTDSIRQNRNGAYIRKGNTYRGIREWKRMDRKISREEGKRICRNYVDELEIPEKEIRAEIKELRDSRKWAVNALCDVIEEMSRKSNFDLLDAVKEIRGEIDEIDTQIEALKDVLRTGEADRLVW